MKDSHDNTPSTKARQLPPHAYHPNPSFSISRKPYIAMPE